MNSQDPQLHELDDEDGQPATKGHVRNAVDELAQTTAKGFAGVDRRFVEVQQRFDQIEKDIAALKQGQDRIETGMAAILSVLDSIEGRLKDWEGIPKKVERLHKRVFHR